MFVNLAHGGWTFKINLIGFGTMPSLVLDVFGTKRMAVVYGSMLTAWGIAGVVGPQLVAGIKDHCPLQASVLSFSLGAVFLLVGFIISWLLSNVRFQPHSP